MYGFENQKCAAPLIPWVQADETPLRPVIARSGRYGALFCQRVVHG